MPTFTALTTLLGQDAAQALGSAIETLDPPPTGIGVFEVEDGSGMWEVGAYFTEPPDDIALTLLAAAYRAHPFRISQLPQTDWVAHVQRGLHPITAGRFFVYGAHDVENVPKGKTALMIEASMAFGTGHHGTTQGCLAAFDALLHMGHTPTNVADIGCGTAVLAIAAAKTCPAPVIASDIDSVAVEVAQANVRANGVMDRVLCIEATGFSHPNHHSIAPYDLVFANILKGPLIQLAPAMAAHTAPGGYVILSGVLNDQASEVLDTYQAHGFALSNQKIITEWATLTLCKVN